MVKIRYEKPRKTADSVKKYLNATSYKQLGEKTFDYFIEMEELNEE